MHPRARRSRRIKAGRKRQQAALKGEMPGQEGGRASYRRTRAKGIEGREWIKEVWKERNKYVSTGLKCRRKGTQAPPHQPQRRPQSYLAAAAPAGRSPRALTLLPASMWLVNVFSHRCWPSPPSQGRPWQGLKPPEMREALLNFWQKTSHRMRQLL